MEKKCLLKIYIFQEEKQFHKESISSFLRNKVHYSSHCIAFFTRIKKESTHGTLKKLHLCLDLEKVSCWFILSS